MHKTIKGFSEHQKALAAQFPEYASWHIEMMGSTLDQLSGMPHEISEHAVSLQSDKGMFIEGAIENAVESLTTKCRSPKGCLFARIRKRGQGPVLVTLRTEGLPRAGAV